jgi:hypothetical protein
MNGSTNGCTRTAAHETINQIAMRHEMHPHRVFNHRVATLETLLLQPLPDPLGRVSRLARQGIILL